MSTAQLRIAFLLGSPEISGGTYVIYEHASRLQRFGHHVYMLTKEEILPHRFEWHPEAAQLRWITINEAKSRHFDIVIGTWWESPYLMVYLSATHYVYFVQSIESRFFPDEDPTHHDERDLGVWKKYCEATYGCNIPVITEARWIQEYLDDNYNRESFLVRNGIRKDVYKEDGEKIAPREPAKLRVLVEGPVDVGYKNVPKSIELCRKAAVDEVWLLTSSDITEYPGVDRVFSRVPILETPAIYRSCDVLVKLSYIEGMFGPPLEMFHCGGTAIVYDVTGHDEYIEHNQNSYVVARDNEDEVVKLLKRLKDDFPELQRLKQSARQSAAQWVDWEGAAQEFDKALQQICLKKATNKQYLRSWHEQVKADISYRLTKREIDRYQKREEDAEHAPDDYNFVQVYCWAEKDGLEKGVFKWKPYLCRQKVEVCVEQEITGFPFWVRIDPSVRIGALELFSISVTNTRTGTVAYTCQHPDQFHELFVDGTLKNISVPGRALFLSYGYDPQLVLPAVTSGEVGDTLLISIELHEMGMIELVRTNLSDHTTTSRKIMDRAQRLLKRVLARIRN